jgi:pimeloyl-ACP methyl ester carboxylesterase
MRDEFAQGLRRDWIALLLAASEDRVLGRPWWAAVVGRVVGWSVAAGGTGRVDARLLPQAARAQYRTGRHLRAALLELQQVGPESAELLALSRARPTVGQPTLLLIARWGGWPLYRSHRRWVERMASLGARIGAETTVVAGAHLLMLDAPDAVAGGIRRVVQRSAQA